VLKSSPPRGFRLLVFIAVNASAAAAAAVTVRIDYSCDTTGFFGANNPQGATGGAQAKAAMEAAAQFYSGILADTFSAIDVPEKFHGSQGGEATFFWKRRFLDPATGLNNATLNVDVAANEYVVFVGARDLPGLEAGLGGPGGYVSGFATQNGSFTSAEQSQLDAMRTAFSSDTTKRGETSGFGRWGGSIAFDSLANWHFDHTTNPPATTYDFYSVALHELAHTFGFGASDEWNALVSGTNFTGANVKAVFGNSSGAPLASGSTMGDQDNDAHWLQGISESPVYEGAGTQPPIMVPALPKAERRLLTNLDAAALADLGWEIALPTGSSALTASSLSTGGASSGAILSAAGLSLSIVPEPTTATLAAFAALALMFRKPRRSMPR
jgi:hypothetical protein